MNIRRFRSLMVVLAASLMVLAGCADRGKINVSGRFRVSSFALLVDNGPEQGLDCPSAAAALPDVKNGAPVVVTSGGGAVVGKAQLANGRTYVGEDLATDRGGCEWPFSVKLARASLYRFAVADRPPITMNAALVERSAKNLILKISPGR